MKVVFIIREPSSHYGILALSAYVKSRGHDTQLLISSLEKDLFGALRGEDPDLIAFSLTTGRHIWGLELSRQIKSLMDVPIVFGGPHPTYFPEIVVDPCVDYVCIGEGEGALADLMDTLQSGEDPTGIENLAYSDGDSVISNPLRDLIDPLDDLPFVDRTIYHRYPVALDYQRDTCLVLTGRGCPYSCSFCYNSACKKLYRGKGTYLRKRSVDHVVTELRLLKGQYGIRRFIFDDDTFTFHAEWLEEFAEKFSRLLGLPFICNARADNMTERVVNALAAAGCSGVKMGVETGDEDLRSTVLKKPLTDQAIMDASERLRSAGIELQTFNILGIPGGSLKTDIETLRFNLRIRPTHAWCSLLNPYPGTEIREFAAAQGLVHDDVSQEFSRESYFVDTPVDLKDKRSVIHLHHFFDIAVRNPWTLKWILRVIHWPLTPLFELIFKLDYALALKHFYKIRWTTWIRFLLSCRGIY